MAFAAAAAPWLGKAGLALLPGLFGRGGGGMQMIGGVDPVSQRLRGQTANWLQTQGMGNIFMGGANEDYMRRTLQPYQDLFSETRRNALAQAKESAGNLTGSGFNNILGSAAAQSMAQEQAQLGQVRQGIEQRNQDAFLRALLGTSGAGVGTPQPVAEQGFLGSLFGGIGAAAPFLGQLWGQRAQQQQQVPDIQLPTLPGLVNTNTNMPTMGGPLVPWWMRR